MDLQWKTSLMGNYILDGEGFFISYQPFLTINAMGTPAEPETALYIGEKGGPRGKYLILYGDWRKQYEEAYPDKEACLRVYHQNKHEHAAFWTEENLENNSEEGA